MLSQKNLALLDYLLAEAKRGILLVLVFSVVAQGFSVENSFGISSTGRKPLVLSIDEYYQPARPAESFSMGFSIESSEKDLTNRYAADATGLSNGLFVLTQAISEDYISKPDLSPISNDLYKRADAYMLICPKTQAAGNPHPITNKEAEYLEKFVADGGILILVFNSVDDLDNCIFDFKGMNLIAEKFGLEFHPDHTRTLMIPFQRDDPVFFDTRGIIYGNGCTIGLHPRPGAQQTILLESNNRKAPGAIAVRVRYKKGTVLALGDAGTLGNAHFFRDDVGQSDSVPRMFHCLLPDGPFNAYGWKEGLKIKINLQHEIGTSGYMEMNRLLNLPLDPQAKLIQIGPRGIDFKSGRTGSSADANSIDSYKKRTLLAKALWELKCVLEIGKNDGKAFSAKWIGSSGEELKCRLTPVGIVLDLSSQSGSFAPWRWALANELFVNPIDPYAQIGDSWQYPVVTPLPNASLQAAAKELEASGRFCFEGQQRFKGCLCYVVSKTVYLSNNEIKARDVVPAEYADSFDPRQVDLLNSGQCCVVRTWIDQKTLLPVRTELNASATLWWMDRSSPDSFISDHDFITYEHRDDMRFVTIISRRLIADFEIEDMETKQ